MITVQQLTPGAFVEVGGNPVITSLNGEVHAPLATIMSDSWSEEDRAAFGIYTVEPAEVPAGKVAVGVPYYERQSGVVVQVLTLVDAPPAPTPRDAFAELDALKARVAALEAK